MPSGSTHRTINTVASVPFAAALLTVGHRSWLETACYVAGYTFATFFVNPDLDLVSDGYNSWGILRYYWWPYQKALAHRSFLSHFPVISTFFRIVYLLWLPIILIYLLGSGAQAYIRGLTFEWLPDIWLYLLFVIFGMISSDTLHLALDLSSTTLKRKFGIGRSRGHRHEGFFDHHGEARHSKRRETEWRRPRRTMRGATRSRRF